MKSSANRENEKLAKVLSEALQDQKFIILKIYDENGDRQITGLITQIDQEFRRLKVSHEDGIDWIPLDDLLSAEIAINYTESFN
ncbi:hypothetical protein BC351_02760 [Paenibacillus ferrarius]|uniref:YolD-like family protein n=1 Tax=Paenibacillus ferrarius TaxID=1469647 RepID=A0A1V4HTP5_9BACL|nr:YolD-like family protein [Paenibacillus ferrarius]OPH62168.1 hypothetical protein BC351_02760 [Paenibacillus ferrarius]